MSDDLTALEYAVYGVLCAAKRETGPDGARRLSRIWQRLDASDEQIERAVFHLMALGWVRQLDPIMGMIHYEAVALDREPAS
jgi:hypothetical protein